MDIYKEGTPDPVFVVLGATGGIGSALSRSLSLVTARTGFENGR